MAYLMKVVLFCLILLVSVLNQLTLAQFPDEPDTLGCTSQDTTSYKTTSNLSPPDSIKLGILLIQFSDWESNLIARGSVRGINPAGDTLYYSYRDYQKAYLSEGIYKTDNPQGQYPTPLSPDNHIIFGSVNDYWQEASYNQYKLGNNSAIVNAYKIENGDTLVDWVTSVHPRAYFENCCGHALYTEAIDTALQKGWLSSESEFDKYAVVWANHYEGETGLWPSEVGNHFIVWEKRGGRLGDGASGNLAGNYTFIHESGHLLGLPDIRGGGSGDGLGDFSLMATYSSNYGWAIHEAAPHLSSYEKMRLGWLTPTEITSIDRNQSIPNVEESDFALVYDVNGMDSNNWTSGEYFIIENRQPIGFDYFMRNPTTGDPGGGLLIYHKGTQYFNNQINIKILEADGTNDLDSYYGNTGDLGDFFPGTDNVRSITDHTTPNTNEQSGDFSHFAILNISNSQDEMTADFYPNAWGGTIAQNTTWSNEVYVYSSITINNNATLTIDPSTTVRFAENKSLTISGGATLDAEGTENSPITFTSAGSRVGPGDWNGIRIINGGSNSETILDYVEVKYATNGIYVDNTGIEIKHSYIHHNENDGVLLADGASALLQYNTIAHNGARGVESTYSSSAYLGESYASGRNRVFDNSYGVYCIYSGYAFIGWSGVGGGDNSIYDADNYAALAAFGSEIHAEITWWGTTDPVGQAASLFYTYNSSTIDYQPYLTSDPGYGSPLAKANNSTPPETPTPPVVDNNDPSSLYNAGNYYSFVGDTVTAFPLLRRVINAFPTSDYAIRALTQLYHFQLEMNRPGLRSYLQGVSEREACPPRLAKRALLLQTYLAVQEANTPRSIQLILQIITNYPGTDAELYGLYFIATHPGIDASISAESALATLKEQYPNTLLTLQAREIMGETVDWSQYNIGLGKRDFTNRNTQSNLPVSFALHRAYPNPFNPSTTIQYDLPEAAHVSLRIYNLQGQLIATLFDNTQPAGYYQVLWDGTDQFQKPVASGVYFCRMVTPQYTKTVKMMLVR